MESAAISARLMDLLGLRQSPVSLAFAPEPPAGVTEDNKAVPSACSFWREVERGLFYAPPEQHFNCPVGAMVMGFELPEGVMQNLGGLVESMCSKGYLTSDEPARIPLFSADQPGLSTALSPNSKRFRISSCYSSPRGRHSGTPRQHCRSVARACEPSLRFPTTACWESYQATMQNNSWPHSRGRPMLIRRCAPIARTKPASCTDRAAQGQSASFAARRSSRCLLH